MRARLSLLFVGAAAAAAVLAGGASGCKSQGCGDIGCVPGATIGVRSSGGWTPGVYTFALTVDGAPATCTVTVPFAEGGLLPDGIVMGSCSGGRAALSFVQDSTCVTTTNGMAVSQTCTPIAGQFAAGVRLGGTPAQATVTVSRDGTALGSQTLTLAYTMQLDGCGGGCQEATAAISIAAGTSDGGGGGPNGGSEGGTDSGTDGGDDAGADGADGG
jgi:hypothetical protein